MFPPTIKIVGFHNAKFMICYLRYGTTVVATFRSKPADNYMYIGFSIYNKISKELTKLPFIADDEAEELMDFVFRVLRNRRDSLRGVAKCHPNDEFDFEVGKKLAKARLLDNYYRIQKDISKEVIKRIHYQLNNMFCTFHKK